MAEEKLPLCKDCKHYWPTGCCGRPTGPNLVYGGFCVLGDRCGRERNSQCKDACGPSGKYFEPKPPGLVQRILTRVFRHG